MQVISRWASKVYFCPLMNRRRCRPDTRAYSLLRTGSSASPRCRSTWNLLNRMLACGACRAVAKRNGFHMSMTTSRDARGLPRPPPRVELVQARLGAIRAAKPDRAVADQVAGHDAVGVALLDRDLVEPEHAGPGRPRSAQLLAHVLLLERLHGGPRRVAAPWPHPGSGRPDSAVPRRRRSAWCKRDCPRETRGAPASPCHSADRPRVAPRRRGRSADRRRQDLARGVACGRTSRAAPGRRSRRPFF